MKQIVKFIIYKVLEVAGAAVVWWGLSWYGHWIGTLAHGNSPDYSNWLVQWILGPLILGLIGGIVLPVLVIYVCCMIVYGLYYWIKWNWKKAGE